MHEIFPRYACDSGGLEQGELGLGERPPAIVKRTHVESPGGELFGIIA